MKNKKYLYLLLIIIPIIVFFVGNSFSITYTQAIKKVEIESNDYDNPGGWHIDKSAEWVDFGKARVTFDISSIMKIEEARYKDVIIVFDISGSMSGDKMDKAKEDSIELIDYLLEDIHNRVALISFESTSTIESDFTTDKDALEEIINNLQPTGATNYDAGLLNVDTLLHGYTRPINTDLIVLFLTDGYPNEDLHNEKAIYGSLKDKYPYMTINGIQYEMGDEIIEDIIDISDIQFIAYTHSLKDILFDASLNPVNYEKFVISDFINDDYFEHTSLENIRVPYGEVTLEEVNGVQKVVWDLGERYKTGQTVQMTIDIDLKDDYEDVSGLYPTNKSESIVSKLPNESQKTVDSELTPVLKNAYNVIYDTNEPDNCTLPEYTPEEHFVFTNVTKKQDILSCPGYLFKGWEVDGEDNKDIKTINDDVFIMPNHNVTIRATWTKEDLVKEMEGTVHVKTTLYKAIQNDANIGTYAKKYTGDHQDSIAGTGTSDIYYYYGNDNTKGTYIRNNKMNVIFANHCWQILRTTDTGGVKLIYNGEPEDGTCFDTRGTHVGYNGTSSPSLSGNYFYGTDYIYDETDNKFKLSGDIEQVQITSGSNSNAASVIPTLAGKYTCRLDDRYGKCTTLYLIYGYSSSTNAKAIAINTSSHYSQFGKLGFNESSKSPAYFGYMYNNVYTVSGRGRQITVVNGSPTISTSWYYADEYDYGTLNAGKYTLIDPQPISNLSNLRELEGKYVIRNGTSSDSSISYVLLVTNNTTMFIKVLSNGTTNVSITVGDTYQKNNDGTYTVKNSDNTPATAITYKEWYNNQATYSQKYFCEGLTDTCSNVMRIIKYTNSVGNIYYASPDRTYKYSETVDYNNGTYTLTGDIQEIWDISDETELAKLNTHHYTCLSLSTTCSPQVYFIAYYYRSSHALHYVALENVDGIDTALTNMLSVYTDNNKVNTKDSLIKMGIDAWYKEYLYDDFDSYIEDTIYCNERKIKTVGSWSETGLVSSGLILQGADSSRKNLMCENETDRFSTLNEKALLKYKVGLGTYDELNLLYNSIMRNTGQSYFTLTPDDYGYSAGYRDINSSGSIASSTELTVSHGVRPVISLVPDIEYLYGDGSMEHPYQIDDGTH